MPPSTNNLWRQGGKGVVYRSKGYNDWTSKADQLMLINKIGPIRMLEGPFIALIELDGTNKKRRGDVDNRVKAVLDYASRIGLIEDDKFAEWVTVGWVTNPKRVPPYGCRLTLREHKKKGDT